MAKIVTIGKARAVPLKTLRPGTLFMSQGGNYGIATEHSGDIAGYLLFNGSSHYGTDTVTPLLPKDIVTLEQE